MGSCEVSIEVVEPEPEQDSKAGEGQGTTPLARALDGFKLIRQIGNGAMGEVHLAEHRVIGSRVAVKFLRPHLARRLHLVEQFFEEARAANRVGHQGIVRVFDLKFVPPDCYFLVMEYLEGRPLSRLIGTPQPLKVAVPLLAQLCDTLDAVHKAGLVHQDIKPDNIFLEPRGRAEVPRLLDFGAARLRAVPMPSAPGGLTVVGTPGYMPPEQWRGQPADGRTDLYAVGMVAYQLVTGVHPFEDMKGTPKEAFVAHRDREPQDPRALHPDLPAQMAELILRAISKSPEDRWSSAGEMARALRRVLRGPRDSGTSEARVRGRQTRTGSSTPMNVTLQVSAERPVQSHPGPEATLQFEGDVWLKDYSARATASTTTPTLLFGLGEGSASRTG